MGLVRAVGCSIASGFAIVLCLGTALAEPNITVSAIDNSGTLDAGEQCTAQQACIDRYLWSVYERAP